MRAEPFAMKLEPYAILILCAGGVDAKTRSKWSRALRVAEAHGVELIREFATEQGGINAVAVAQR